MSSLFIDSRKRLKRAVVHAETVKAIWETLIDPKSYKTVIEPNTDWTEAIVKYVRSEPIPENDLAVECGEMFYQLRSALDHLVFKACVIAEKTDRPSNEDSVEFPIYTNSKKFHRNPINNAPFPHQLRNWLESIQPYNVSKHSGTDLEPFIHALRILHDCARKDRHRKLHVVAAVPTEIKWRFDVFRGRLLSVHPLKMNLLEGENEFLRLRLGGFDAAGSSGKIQLNSEVLIEISIDEIPVSKPGDSAAALNWIFESVDRAITHFEDWFK